MAIAVALTFALDAFGTWRFGRSFDVLAYVQCILISGFTLGMMFSGLLVKGKLRFLRR